MPVDESVPRDEDAAVVFAFSDGASGGGRRAAGALYLAARDGDDVSDVAPVRGSLLAYRVNRGPWAVAAAHALPRRRYHAALSLFTDAQGACARNARAL